MVRGPTPGPANGARLPATDGPPTGTPNKLVNNENDLIHAKSKEVGSGNAKGSGPASPRGTRSIVSFFNVAQQTMVMARHRTLSVMKNRMISKSVHWCTLSSR